MDYIGQMAAGYSTGLKWNEIAKLKSDMMLVRHRWLGVDVRALEEKCRAVGLDNEDTATVLELVRRVQAGKRLVPLRSYRGSRWGTEREVPSDDLLRVTGRAVSMPIRKLPNLSPEQVERLQDALLSNADALLESALSLLDQGRVALARSLAILGLEESGKAIAVHERRIQVVREPEGTPFRCDWLDALWASHEQKLSKVYDFLCWEPYWFAEQPPDSDENAAMLGTIRHWAARHDNLKKRGFYVELDRKGKALMPADVAEEDSLRAVLSHVHQIGWQIRLGEHIEGKQQDQREAGSPPGDPESWTFIEDPELREALLVGVPGEPLNNAAYRFNPPGADRSPFRNLGKPGYEADTRQLAWLAEDLERETARRAETQSE